MKLLLAFKAIMAACLLTISKLHDDGTMVLASTAEEYSVCTNVNACSDDDLREMTDLLLEQDEMPVEALNESLMHRPNMLASLQSLSRPQGLISDHHAEVTLVSKCSGRHEPRQCHLFERSGAKKPRDQCRVDLKKQA